MTQLRALQMLFWQAITEGDASASLQAAVAPTGSLSSAARVQIYATMYIDRLVEALGADFPNVAKALGHQAFGAMARAYVRAHPSTQPSINALGRHLPAFLQAHADLPRPDLADLAALEWARVQVFDAAADASVAAQVLGSLPAEQLPHATFTFVRALRMVPTRFDVGPLWRALEDDAPVPAPQATPQTLVIWRPAHDVLHTTLAPMAADALRLALQGANLDAVCEAFAAADNPVQSAFAAMGAWFTDGWVKAVQA